MGIRWETGQAVVCVCVCEGGGGECGMGGGGGCGMGGVVGGGGGGGNSQILEYATGVLNPTHATFIQDNFVNHTHLNIHSILLRLMHINVTC